MHELPRFRGAFELDVDSYLTADLLAGKFENKFAELVAAVVCEDDHVIDVGANVGLYSVLLGKVARSGKVLAIEPSPHVLPLLRLNLERNQIRNAQIFEGVCSASRGTTLLHYVPGNDEYSSMAQLIHPDAPRKGRRTTQVATDTLDHLVEVYQLKPSFIKIDVEGAECLVLQGASKVLSYFRPLILSELDDRLLNAFGHSAASVHNLLIQHGYNVIDASRGVALNTATAGDKHFVGEIYAVPREQQRRAIPECRDTVAQKGAAN